MRGDKVKILNRRNILITVVIAVLITAFYFFQFHCTLDGDTVCYINKDDTFQIEDNAEISVQVASASVGEYLVETWNALHPEHLDAVRYVVSEPLDLKALTETMETDIIMTSIYNAAYVLDKMQDLGKDGHDHILDTVHMRHEGAINLQGTYFVPNSINGWSFVYNQTLAEEMGLDLTDTNGDGLPDSFDTFEKIFEMETMILDHVEVLFPFTFVDQYSFYPFLTTGKWTLNFTHKGMDPGFDKNEFLNGLDFIEAMGSVTLRNGEITSAQALPWGYDVDFFGRNAVFSMVSDWMRFDYQQDLTEDVYVKAPFPTYNNNPISPMGEVTGYMVQDNTKYPSASAEALRILRAPEVTKVFEEKDSVLVYHDQAINDLDIEDTRKQEIWTYAFHKPEPVIALDENPKVLARELYYDIDIMPVLMDLFDGTITKEEAQTQIIELSEIWLNEKTGDIDVENTD